MATVLTQDIVRTRDTCRLCGSSDLVLVWSFGSTPLANAYVSRNELGRPEPFVPLEVYSCRSCYLVQLRDVVSPGLLFSRYLYVSSTSSGFVQHFHDFAARLLERFHLHENTLAIDVGSNDGILLKPLRQAGVQVLGIDPARNIAEAASAGGIETLAEFFSPETAQRVVHDRGKATVITASNVFAHTDDVIGFVEAVTIALAENGVFVFEVQYLGDLLAKNLFDIVYHEHVCYYHLQPLITFFDRRSMEVFDVERLSVHGGSLRVYVQRTGGPYPVEARVGELLHEEAHQTLNHLTPYQQFAERIDSNRQRLCKIISEIRAAGNRIVGYGAPAKATTLMYTFGLDNDDVDYIVDDDRRIKQGMFMPGTHIPIVSPEYLYKPFGQAQERATVCLILAWNFAESIMHAHQRFVDEGGQFIVPVPEPRIVSRI